MLEQNKQPNSRIVLTLQNSGEYGHGNGNWRKNGLDYINIHLFNILED